MVVTHADSEPGATIARVLRHAGYRVSGTVQPRIVGLVNSFQLPAASAPVEDLAFGDYLESVNTNLTESFFACQAAARQMIAEGIHGTIVNVTSVGGVVALPHQAAFSSSMAAISAVTKVLATEWAQYGVRVAAVGAGLSRELGASSGALVSPEDVAKAVRFILTEEASAIAGVPLYVDRGWLSNGYWEPFP